MSWGLEKETLKPSVRIAGVPVEIRMRANQFGEPRLKNPVVKKLKLYARHCFRRRDVSRIICGFH
jgi:hypothetical protein